MEGTLPKISFLKLQGGGAPITLRGLKGVDGMDLDHNKNQNTYFYQDLSNQGSKKC
jgi:hypothetical protein